MHLPGCQPNKIAIANVIMKNKLFQNRQKMDGANRLRSAESASDIKALNQTADLSSEPDRPMFEGSPEQSYEESAEPRNTTGDQSSFNIFSKPKDKSRGGRINDASRRSPQIRDMTSSTPSPTPQVMPTLAEEPSEAGQPVEDFRQMHGLRAKRKDEEASSNVPERKQQVMTES